MTFSRLAIAASILTAITQVSAHGTASGIVVDGTYFQGYSPSFQFANPPPVVVGWSSPEDLDNGFVSPAAFSDPDIICHKGATPGQTHAAAKAGSTIEIQWTPWPESHKGPVIDYLANCNGPCESVDKTTLEFFKIDAGGLVDGSSAPGKWASDELIANNNTWTLKIPSDIAPGNYVLRHEIIALHAAGSLDGAQNYPQCFNLAITGSGTAAPAGVLGTALYKDTDPGILIGIYQALSSYIIPGPAVYDGGAEPAPVSSAASSAPSSAATSTADVVTAIPTSAPQATSTSVSASATPPFSNSTSPAATTPAPTRGPTAVPAPESSADESCSEALVTLTVTVTPVAAAPTEGSSSLEPSSTATPSPVTDIPVVSKPVTGTEPETGTEPVTSPVTTPVTTPITEIPEGTTFKTLLAWLDEVVTKIAGGDKALLGRRHARQLGA